MLGTKLAGIMAVSNACARTQVAGVGIDLVNSRRIESLHRRHGADGTVDVAMLTTARAARRVCNQLP